MAMYSLTITPQGKSPAQDAWMHDGAPDRTPAESTPATSSAPDKAEPGSITSHLAPVADPSGPRVAAAQGGDQPFADLVDVRARARAIDRRGSASV